MSQNSFELSQYLNPDFLIKSGKVLSTVGTLLLITETILGLFAFELAILAIALFKKNEGGGNSNSFLLGYLYANLSNNHWCLSDTSLLGIAVASFIQSIVASLLLAFQFHMPIIAIAVAAAWVAAIAMIIVGNALECYGNDLKKSPATQFFRDNDPSPSAPPYDGFDNGNPPPYDDNPYRTSQHFTIV